MIRHHVFVLTSHVYFLKLEMEIVDDIFLLARS